MTDIEAIKSVIDKAVVNAIANERRKLKKAIQQRDEARARAEAHRLKASGYQKELAQARTELRSKT